MAVRETTRSWSGQSNPAWGLTTKVGPWKETPADLQKFNSRAGGPHAGHGNWMQSFNPHPYIQTMPTPGLPNYVTSDVVMPEDFDVPRGMKIPGVNKMGSKGASGVRTVSDTLSSKYGVNGSNPQNGAQGNGLENLKETKKDDNAFPKRILTKPMTTSPLGMDIDFTSNRRASTGGNMSIATNTSGKLSAHKRQSTSSPVLNLREPRQRGYGLRGGSSTNYAHHNGPNGINI